MQEQTSGMERFRVWVLAVNSTIALLLGALSFYEKLPKPIQEVVREHPYTWGGCLLALLLTGGCFWFIFSPKSRLLMPERLIIRADEPRHLKGRKGEVRELMDLCERHPLVFLEGESGSGKSALVRAGLVDECCRRHKFYPLYLDLSGADWEERLPALLAGELWRSLPERDRQVLDICTPCAPNEIFSLLGAFASHLGLTPLLIFDQFDDYQSAYRLHFHEGREGSTWIKAGQLVSRNRFWREISGLVESRSVHCLFVTRTDNAAGLDTVRFVEARTFRLSRVSSSLMAPLLEEVTVEMEGRPVVAQPERGWEQLKRRLLRDLSEDDVILPIRLSVALQALRRFRVLTVREYQRFGGAEGLEQLHIERSIVEASQASGLSNDQVRKALLELVDPVGIKTIQLNASDLRNRIVAKGLDEPGLQRLQNALQYFESGDVVRRRAADSAGEDVWLLYHDFLCRGVMAAERHASRWHALLHERARQFSLSTGVLRRWRALLSPLQQLRLALMRLKGRFRYADHRRFALVSTARFLPYLMVLLVLVAGFWAYRDSQDDHLARSIFATLRSAPSEHAKLESAQIRLLASSPERVQWKVLELAFANEKNAAQAEKCLPVLLHAYLRLDPTGDRWKRFWTGIVRPALKDRNSSAMIPLALAAFEEAPGVDGEAPTSANDIAQKLLDVMETDLHGHLLWSNSDKFQFLTRYLKPEQAQRFCDEILKKMEIKEDLQSRVSLARALDPFASNLSKEQASRAVRALIGARVRKGDHGVGTYNYALAPALEPFVPNLSSRDAELISKEIVEAMASPSEDHLLELRHDALRILGKRLDAGQLRALANRLVEVSSQESDPRRLAWLMRVLGPTAEYAPLEFRQQAIRKLLDAMEQEQDGSKSELFFQTLRANRKVLEPEQGCRAAQVFFRRMEQEKRPQTLAELLERIGAFADSLDPELSQLAWDRMLKCMEEGHASGWNVDYGSARMADLARRLSQAQRAELLDKMIDFYVSLQLYQVDETGSALVSYFHEIGPLLGKEPSQAMVGKLVRLIEAEQNTEKVHNMCYMAFSLGAAADADLARQVGTRVIHLMENENDLQELRILSRTLVHAKADLPDLRRQAANLLLGSLIRRKKGYSAIPSHLDLLAMELKSYADYIEAADAQHAMDVFVDISLTSELTEPSLGLWGFLEPLWRKVSKESVGDLATRVACRVRESAAETTYRYSIGVYGSSEESTAAFLQYAPDEVLVGILEEPFALDPLRRVVLRALELKYGEEFKGNLGMFAKWALSNPQTRNLVASPPHPGFLRNQTGAGSATDCARSR